MLILGIDTSCDDTSAALLEISDTGRPRILSNVVSSQNDIHVKYGGIVPELASRQHIEMIWPVVTEALGGTPLESVSAVAVCHGPGLIGSLLVGCSFAKSMCYAKGIPLVGVNHLEGHLLSPFLMDDPLDFPFFSLIVSGGHTSLYKVTGYCEYEEVGRTRDDAAGEAYDKVSKLLGLGYPGGPEIDRLAALGDPKSVDLPRPYLPGSMDFSFSGLKTAVRLAYENAPDMPVENMAASFQSSVVDVLARKIEWAIRDHGVNSVAIAGGVAANRGLREKMSEICSGGKCRLSLPPVALCTDNAAMIALAGYHRFMRGERHGLDLNPKAHLPL